ncbi:MAG TPA: RDD family protein [Candidatus Acidoferrum sp.]|nr:RDD family protein [Candidatus Acidoferrum sp.]
MNREAGGDPRSRAGASSEVAWRSELSERLASYRARRRRSSPNEEQSQFFFEREELKPPVATQIAAEEPPRINEEGSDFSFTIAIGRCAPSKEKEGKEMFIDVSLPPNASQDFIPTEPVQLEQHSGLYPVASMDERRIAALIDGACLLFAYGGFLALFGSLGGQFTFSKMSATVYTIAFAIVYLQYFFLFTVFGGTTPGMMLRGLQVVDFSGEPPAPRKLLLRAAGYVLSAGTFCLGFLWAMWDEDELTWHDRISHTYLSPIERAADSEISGAIHGHS